MKKMLAGLLQLVSYLVVFGVIASLLAELVVPIEGPNYCKTAFRSAYPDLARESSVVRGVWTRTQGERWLSALVVQPMDITQERATVVCRFAGANYTDGPVELIKGDRLQELKDVSMSNLDPRTWFK